LAPLPIWVVSTVARLCHDRRMITELSNELADAVAAAAPSVVQVVGRRRPASGLVYADDAVLTTMSAIRREDGLQVRRDDGRTFDAELLGWDPATGLAVLRVAGLGAVPMAPSAAAVRVGHIGLAVARSWSNAITASAGIVAIIGGPLHTSARRTIDQIFRTTAPMHDGFAGGAFLDASGALIGVATAASIRGLGVIIPAAIAWKAAASVLEHGRIKHGYLGVAGQPVTLPEHQRGGTDRERGVLTFAVTPDGPAAQAGLLVGDVLLAIDDTPIESPEELMDMLMATGAGHRARLQVLRGGAATELTVNIGERPLDPARDRPA
jgi:S1-C subfamily serine protease